MGSICQKEVLQPDVLGPCEDNTNHIFPPFPSLGFWALCCHLFIFPILLGAVFHSLSASFISTMTEITQISEHILQTWINVCVSGFTNIPFNPFVFVNLNFHT